MAAGIGAWAVLIMIHQSINQSINQLANQPIKYLIKLAKHTILVLDSKFYWSVASYKFPFMACQ